MKKILWTTLVLFFAIQSASAGSFFRSVKDPDNDQSQPIPTEPPVNPDPIEVPINENFDVFKDVAFPMAEAVDDIYPAFRELNMPRGPASSEPTTDQCHSNFEGNDTFADRMAFFVNYHIGAKKNHIHKLSSYYDVPSDLDRHVVSSLAQYPLCRVTSSTLSKTIGSKRVPNSSTISLASEFSSKSNELRERMLEGDDEASLEFNQLWTKFMGCLAYTESLTTADSSRSYRVADEYAPSSYRKPEGVKFYEDPYQDEASKLNIGLFQFTPTWYGNVNPCIRNWNAWFPSCSVGAKPSKNTLIKTFGSSYQTFNAFCGVNKFVQTYAIQQNTTRTKSTHPDNYSGGRLKSPGSRCVTPFFYSGWAYNHYGPMQNSTGKNMRQVLSCALAE